MPVGKRVFGVDLQEPAKKEKLSQQNVTASPRLLDRDSTPVPRGTAGMDAHVSKVTFSKMPIFGTK